MLNFNLLILASTTSGCVYFSEFASPNCVPVDIANSAVGLKICAIAEGIKKYKLIINNKKNHDKIVLLGKDKLDNNEVLISKALIDSYISHFEFI